MSTRPIAVLVAGAALLAGSLVTPAVGAPNGAAWENTRQSDSRTDSDVVDVATSADGRAYLIGFTGNDTINTSGQSFLRAVDTGTGATLWEVEDLASSGVERVVVDEGSGQVIVARTTVVRSETGGTAVVRAYSRDGHLAWEKEFNGLYVDDLVVDGSTGQVCAALNSPLGRRWSITCWTRSGELRFEAVHKNRRNGPGNLNLAIDERSHRVYLGGTRYRGQTQVVLRAYTASGRRLWTRAERLGRNYLDGLTSLVVDPGNHRVYTLSDGRRLQPQLVGYRAGGRQVFSRTIASKRRGSRIPARNLDLLPRSHRLAVTSHSERRDFGNVKILSKSGRQLATRNHSTCCTLVDTEVDPRRDRLVLAFGPKGYDDGDGPFNDRGVRAKVYNAKARLVGTALVGRRGDIHRARAAALDPTTGLLLVGGALSSRGVQPYGMVRAARIR